MTQRCNNSLKDDFKKGGRPFPSRERPPAFFGDLSAKAPFIRGTRKGHPKNPKIPKPRNTAGSAVSGDRAHARNGARRTSKPSVRTKTQDHLNAARSAAMRETAFDENMTIEPVHLGNGEYADSAEGARRDGYLTSEEFTFAPQTKNISLRMVGLNFDRSSIGRRTTQAETNRNLKTAPYLAVFYPENCCFCTFSETISPFSSI